MHGSLHHVGATRCRACTRSRARSAGIACAAVASDQGGVLAAVVRRPGATPRQLLKRLECAVQRADDNDVRTEEAKTRPPSRQAGKDRTLSRFHDPRASPHAPRAESTPLCDRGARAGVPLTTNQSEPRSRTSRRIGRFPGAAARVLRARQRPRTALRECRRPPRWDTPPIAHLYGPLKLSGLKVGGERP